MFILPTPFIFLEFQIKHYSERMTDARTIEERIFLRKNLYDLKQSLSAYYN